MPAPTVRPTVQHISLGLAHDRHRVQEPAQALLAGTRVDPWLHQLSTSLAVDAATLNEFKVLMRGQGFTLELSRFFLDLVYGYRQLAIAHSLGIPRLRTLALELFEACQRLDHRRRELTARSPAH